MIDSLAILKTLVLIGAANGAPIFVRNILQDRFRWPVDGGLLFPDGRPVFGPSKTIRGILSGTVMAVALAPAMGLSLVAGLVIGASAMAGDLLSSFLKRRLKLDSSSRAIGLDQIPEALLPALAAAPFLHYGVIEIGLVTLLFFIGSFFFSKLLYRLHIRRRPY